MKNNARFSEIIKNEYYCSEVDFKIKSKDELFIDTVADNNTQKIMQSIK